MPADATPNAAPFSDEQVVLASSNYESQEWLMRALRNAFHMTRLTIEDLARELDLSAEEAESWISGEVDLSLAELRHLANAVDAQVTYRVSPLRTIYLERFREMGDGLWQESERWTETAVPR